MNARIFREYDIRGVAERDLDDATVRAIGRAVGERAAGPVVVGRDCRITSPRLFSQLTDGIRAHAEVIDIGVVPMDVGAWMMHCHILEHAEAGMMMMIDVIEGRDQKPAR